MRSRITVDDETLLILSRAFDLAASTEYRAVFAGVDLPRREYCTRLAVRYRRLAHDIKRNPLPGTNAVNCKHCGQPLYFGRFGLPRHAGTAVVDCPKADEDGAE